MLEPQVLHKRGLTDPSLMLDLPLWDLDGASFKSRDRFGHLCTSTNTTWGLKGRNFPGSGYITVGDGTFFDTIPANGGFGAWVYVPAPISAGGSNQQIFQKVNDETGGTVDYMGLLFRGSTGKITSWMTINNVEIPVESTETSWAVGWYHIFFTWGAAGMKQYINGEANGTNANTNVPAAGVKRDFIVGAGNYGGAIGSKFTGTIKSVRILSRQLNILEVQNDYLKWKYKM